MSMRAKLFGSAETEARHRERFSLRNPWMSAWFVLLILIPLSRFVLYVALAVGVYHVVIGGMADLLRAGNEPGTPGQGRETAAKWGRWTWALLLAAGLAAYFVASPGSLTRTTGGVLIAAGLALGTVRARRGSRVEGLGEG